MHLDFTITAGEIGNFLTLVGIFLAYLHSRKRREEKSDQRHSDNQDRLKEIEGRLDPIWGWFTRNVINGHGK